MVMNITNTRAVQPFVSVVNMAVKINDRNTKPNNVTKTETVAGILEYDLETPIYSIDLISVYVDGFRMINTTLDFGKTYSSYTIQGSKIIFKQAVSGILLVFMDLPSKEQIPTENTFKIKNVQGAKTPAKQPNEVLASLFCAPLILTQPQHGVAYLSDDRKSIAYMPNSRYEGFDAFSYTVISDRGQVADPKCVYVKVGNPRETK